MPNQSIALNKIPKEKNENSDHDIIERTELMRDQCPGERKKQSADFAITAAAFIWQILDSIRM